MSKLTSRSASFSSKSCPRCKKPLVTGERVVVGDHSVHEACFVCSVCRTRLTASTGNYMEVDGVYYCREHSLAFLENPTSASPRGSTPTSADACPLCRQPVQPGEGITLDSEEMVHKSCFACSECQVTLDVGNFHALSDKLYCPVHFFQRKAESNANGRKKTNLDLDADPLQQSLTDLEDQERRNSARSRYISVPAAPSHSSEDGLPGSVLTSSQMREASSREELLESTTLSPRLGESDDPGKEVSRSMGESETEYIDLSEEGLDHLSAPSDKSEENKNRIEPRLNRHTSTEPTDEPSEAAEDSKKGRKRKKEFKFSRHNSESVEKRTRRSKKNTDEHSEVPPEDRKLLRSGSKSKKSKRSAEKSEKSERSAEKSERSAREDGETEDKRKKSGKRGLFSIKKRKDKKDKATASSSDMSKELNSPSLTSFVSSRFRKKREDSTSSLKSTSSTTKATPTSTASSTAHEGGPPETSEDLSDDLEELGLEPLGDVKMNRIGRLKSGGDSSSRVNAQKHGSDPTHSNSPSRFAPLRESKFAPTEPEIQSILPISFSTPVSLVPLPPVEECTNELEEDLPLTSLDLPPSSTTPNYSWASYELERNIPPMQIELPETVLPPPTNIQERIEQTGYFEVPITSLGLIGIQRRGLELLSHLQMQYPLTTQIVAVTEVCDGAYELLQERTGNPVARVPLTELLHKPEINWIFVGSVYKARVDHIVAALSAGKNVFCEKPICFSVADCLRLKAAQAKSSAHFMCSYMWRLLPFYQEMRHMLQTGFLGDVVSVEMNNLLEPSSAGLLMSDWTRHSSQCHTLLFETVCYEIDLLNWLLESLPSQVASFGGRNIFLPKNKPATQEDLQPYMNWPATPLDPSLTSEHPFTEDKDVDDNYTLMMEYRNQARVSCHINTNAAFPQKRILICGLKGTLEGDLHTGIIRFKLIGDHGAISEIRVSPGESHGGADRQTMETLMDLTHQQPVDDTIFFKAEDIFPSVIATLGFEQSKQTGSIVNLEEQWKQLGV